VPQRGAPLESGWAPCSQLVARRDQFVPAATPAWTEARLFSEVFSYARQEMIARSGPLTHHKLRFRRFYHGQASEGEDAWVGRFQDRTAGAPVCVRVWKTDETIVSESFSGEIDDCSADQSPAPPPAA
jgi:hypothetical protein